MANGGGGVLHYTKSDTTQILPSDKESWTQICGTIVFLSCEKEMRAGIGHFEVPHFRVHAFLSHGSIVGYTS